MLRALDVKRLFETSLPVVALLAALAMAQAQAPIPEPRTALVIGNGAYSYGALTNPVNDADAVAKALQDAGFDVTQTDADQAEMQGEIHALDGKLKAKGGADGSATETLEPFGAAAPSDIALSDVTYKVEGRNPDGSDYEGTVEIAKQGKAYHLSWQVGSSSYEGNGKLAGNLLTVDWGSSTTVVYALAAGGSLTGLWGAGEETLTPEE